MEEISATAAYAAQYLSVYQLRARQSSPADLTSQAAGLLTGMDLPEHYYQPPRLISKEQWQLSRYRDMPYQEGMSEEWAQALRDMKQSRDAYNDVLARSPGGFGRVALRALTFVGVQALDPINYIPFVGMSAKPLTLGRAASAAPAVLGAVGTGASRGYLKATGIGAVDATLGNALVDAVAVPNMNASGDDVGWREVATDLILGAGVGGIFGAMSQVIARRGMARAADGHTVNDDALIQAADLHDGNIKASIAQLIEGDEVNHHLAMRQIQQESLALSHAYDNVLHNPQGGPHDEVLAITSSPEFEQILVERGPSIWQEDGSLIVRGKQIAHMFPYTRGQGLVKIIWRHGEKSPTKPELQVTKEDVVNLARYIKEYAPVENAGRRQKSNETRWSIDLGNDINLVIAVTRQRGQDKPTIITMFKNDFGGYGKSEKRTGPLGLSGEGPAFKRQTPPEDTAGGSTAQTPRSQEALSENITSAGGVVKALMDFATVGGMIVASEKRTGPLGLSGEGPAFKRQTPPWRLLGVM